MGSDEWAIGQRVASHRVRCGLTQEELAGLVGISLSMMKKIESGDRLVTRFSQLVAFAQALRIKDLRDLTGVPLALAPEGRRGHPAVDAVYSALTDRGRSVGSATNLDELARMVEQVWRTWQEPSAFRYDAVGQHVPTLVARAQAAVDQSQGNERRRALRLLSMVYQLTRTWTKRVGEYELSLVAADRAVAAALEADDPDFAGAAAWNLAMILSAQGRVEHARAVVYRAIEDLGARMASPSSERLGVFGGLHLLGAAEAAVAGDGDEVRRLLDLAGTLAERVGETHHFRMAFGPTNVALHRVSTAVEVGRTRDALELVERISIERAPAVERRLTYHIDAARCYARKRNDIAAVHMLQQVWRESPEELRYSSLLRDVLRQLRSRAKPSIAAELGPMLSAASLPD
jgi:transcriptional regulator with XRE-family HTH domain